ncbi:aldo/keto reductase [Streptomyces sp. ET3-23]|uniref:aldo/keto reductase n=1 Tax=Streptomyces sp. ET3-23 TaxID=2885643 RepID=UPI001D1304D6|nr:aldo/keto reductase [Streptomyces sp. ET3-23]MCC2274822.1 aldo/keto reductase [Streptomyces sp. ET3-23]
MRYRYLGRTGLQVSELSFGAATLGTPKAFGGLAGADWSQFGVNDGDDAVRLVHACHDAGVNFFDTADVYRDGECEELLGLALKGRRDKAVIATKARLRTDPDDINAAGSTRHHLVRAVEASLRRLDTDYIDVLYLHGVDPRTSLDETLGVLDDLVRAGKIRYTGCSNFPGWQLMKALDIADRRNLVPFAAYQGYYNLGARELEYEIVPAAVDQGVGVTVFSPLAGGFFTGKYRRGQEASADFRLAHEGPASIAPLTDREQAYDIVDVLDGIAEERGVPVVQVALNWVLGKPGVTSVVFGASRPGQLDDNLRATEWRLTEEEMGLLDAASDRPAPYPYWHMRQIAGDRSLPGDL